jgi:ribosome-associated toxin RatA of RatAB toxin-antitoxin module
MQTVRKSVIVTRPAAAMFALVDECERYPEFLPWCAKAVVHERSAECVRATLEIDYHGLRSTISTVNRMSRNESIDLEFVDGPFDRFKGRWRFVPLGETGCRVEFALDFQLASGAAEALMGPVFGNIMETLVDRFVERAQCSA